MQYSRQQVIAILFQTNFLKGEKRDWTYFQYHVKMLLGFYKKIKMAPQVSIRYLIVYLQTLDGPLNISTVLHDHWYIGSANCIAAIFQVSRIYEKPGLIKIVKWHQKWTLSFQFSNRQQTTMKCNSWSQGGYSKVKYCWSLGWQLQLYLALFHVQHLLWCHFWSIQI